MLYFKKSRRFVHRNTAIKSGASRNTYIYTYVWNILRFGIGNICRAQKSGYRILLPNSKLFSLIFNNFYISYSSSIFNDFIYDFTRSEPDPNLIWTWSEPDLNPIWTQSEPNLNPIQAKIHKSCQMSHKTQCYQIFSGILTKNYHKMPNLAFWLSGNALQSTKITRFSQGFVRFGPGYPQKCQFWLFLPIFGKN